MNVLFTTVNISFRLEYFVVATRKFDFLSAYMLDLINMNIFIF